MNKLKRALNLSKTKMLFGNCPLNTQVIIKIVEIERVHEKNIFWDIINIPKKGFGWEIMALSFLFPGHWRHCMTILFLFIYTAYFLLFHFVSICACVFALYVKVLVCIEYMLYVGMYVSVYGYVIFCIRCTSKLHLCSLSTCQKQIVFNYKHQALVFGV